jgi:tetratricopeptide (TPR) repeat protein
MSEHPHRKTLEALLFNHLSSSETKRTVAHLLGGCDHCRESMSPLAKAMFMPGAPGPEPQLSPEEDAAYERSIAAAFAKALDRERSLGDEREAAERKVEEILRAMRRRDTMVLPDGAVTWGLCEILLEKSRSLRHDDRPGMLQLAHLAQLAADRLDREAYGEERRTDMQARAWAELANAYRINDDFAQAEAAMACALDLRSKGTRDPLLYARIADLNASLLCDQRRFNESFRMLDLAYAILRRYADSHEVGRVIILKGLYTGYAGKPEEGLQLLAQGLSMIDRARDPKLVFHTLHNILRLRVELGECEQARQQLQRMRSLYATYATEPDLMKLRWIEGDIAAGLGDLTAAEAIYQQIREYFDARESGYEASIASLDLAGIWLRQGRTAEVRSLVADLVATFRGLGVEREAMSAIQMLQEALKRDQATLEVLRLVGGILRRLQNQPPTRAGLDSL